MTDSPQPQVVFFHVLGHTFPNLKVYFWRISCTFVDFPLLEFFRVKLPISRKRKGEGGKSTMFSELELYRAKRIIREMAKTNGVSEDEIRAEMNKAIEAGMSDPILFSSLGSV